MGSLSPAMADQCIEDYREENPLKSVLDNTGQYWEFFWADTRVVGKEEPLKHSEVYSPLSTIRGLWTPETREEKKHIWATVLNTDMVAMIPSTISSKEPWRYSGGAPRCNLCPEWYLGDLWVVSQTKNIQTSWLFKSKYTLLFKGIVHNFFVYRSNLIFWIVMGCGIADFGRRGL